MRKKEKNILYLVSTKALTINLFFKNFINENKNKIKIKVICSDPNKLNIDKKINKIGLNFPSKLIDFFNLLELLKLFKQLSSIRNKLKNNYILLNTPTASHFFRIYFFFDKLNFIYFVHGFRFIKNGKWYKNFLFKNIEKILSITTKKFITINSSDYNFVKKKLKGQCIKINGVGIKTKKRNNFKINYNKLKILVVSAYKKEKGYEDVLEIAEFFNTKNLNISFTCYGYGDYKIYDNFIKKKKLKNIHLKKFNINLPKKLKNYSLLLHTSFREGLPVSLIQCLSNGIPVIARDIRGCNDLIKNNVNGYFYKNNNEAIKKIIKLYNNKIKHSEMSNNAFKLINYKYSNKYINKKIFSFINE